MDGETKAHLFEPFFSTKGPGKGTGLGLATVFSIIKQSGGHITVYSELGLGTVFKIYLPMVESTALAAQVPLELSRVPPGRETLLLVEDEEGVRALSRHVLQMCGYTLLEAADGSEAVQVGMQHQGQIDLLLTDVVMPQLSGREVAERLRAVHPEMRVLYVSGYTGSAVVRHGILEETVHFLQKPFSPAALAQKVREVLDEGATQ
jgi:CheY-like chemotaxis protein